MGEVTPSTADLLILFLLDLHLT